MAIEWRRYDVTLVYSTRGLRAPDIRTPLARVGPLVRVHGALVHGQVAGLRAAVVALVAGCLAAVRVRVRVGGGHGAAGEIQLGVSKSEWE